MVTDRFFLGGFEFRMAAPPAGWAPDGNSHYLSFARPPLHAPAPPLTHTLRVHFGDGPLDTGWTFLAETPAWRLESREDARRLSLASQPGRGAAPSLAFARGADVSDLCIPEAVPPGGSPGRHPFRYPLDQLRLLYLLAEHRGLIMHAAGAVLGGGGVILAGKSGAGKSTITRLLEAERPGTVLSDDRVIVRGAGDGLWVHGTPWPGDARVAVNDGAPLRALCFLKHAGENRLTRLDPSATLHRLLEVASVPWFDAEVTSPVLDTCEALARGVPAFELCFQPTPAVVTLLHDAFG